MSASYVIPVRQASALPAPSFRFRLAADTLAVKLVVPPTGSTGDLHSLEGAPCRAHNKISLSIPGKAYLVNPGSVLLSHTVTHAVPSALESLTSVFGMGTGVSSLL